MPSGKTLVLVDGENLSLRYSHMVKEGREPAENTICIGDHFVWNDGIFSRWLWDVLRISYHTSLVGDDPAIVDASREIANVRYKCRAEVIALSGKSKMFRTAEGRLIPRVRKRSSRARKESICDTAISVEALRATYRDHAQKIVVLSGDGDFLPLYEELMHAGREVIVGAFSSGLHPDVPISVDSFIDLDGHYFR